MYARRRRRSCSNRRGVFNLLRGGDFGAQVFGQLVHYAVHNEVHNEVHVRATMWSGDAVDDEAHLLKAALVVRAGDHKLPRLIRPLVEQFATLLWANRACNTRRMC